MKRILMFAGNNPRNALWLDSLSEVFSNNDWAVCAHRYLHWQKEGPFDRRAEVIRFCDQYPDGLVDGHDHWYGDFERLFSPVDKSGEYML